MKSHGPRSQAARTRLLDAARQVFGERGYDRATLRAIGAAAAVNPAMIVRYYQNKEGLFAAAADFDLALPDLRQIPRGEVGRALVSHFLARWENDVDGDNLAVLLRSALAHEAARAKMKTIFETQLTAAIRHIAGDQQAETRSALIATQMLGLALTRYVLDLPAVRQVPRAILVEAVGATIQTYLDTDWVDPAPPFGSTQDAPRGSSRAAGTP